MHAASKERTGTRGKPAPTTVQFVQGVAASGSAHVEDTNVGANVKRVKHRSAVMVYHNCVHRNVLAGFPLMSLHVTPPFVVLKTWPRLSAKFPLLPEKPEKVA